MRTTPAELKAERTRLLAAAREIMARAERRGRDLDAAEHGRAKALLDQADAIGTTLAASAGASPAARQPTEGNGSFGGEMDEDHVLDLGALERRTLDRAAGDSFEKRARSRAGLAADEPVGFDLGDVLRARVFGPRTEREKRAMAVSADTSGGLMVPELVSANVFDRLRPLNAFLMAGAGEADLSGSWFNSYVRISSDATATSHPENAEILQSNPAFQLIRLVPRTIAVNVSPVSMEMLQAAPNLSDVLSQNIAKAMAAEIDRQALLGKGDLEMAGLMTGNVSGVLSTVLGAGAGAQLGGTGATSPNYDALCDAQTTLLTANAPAPKACIMATRDYGSMSKWKSTQNQPLQPPPAIADLKYFQSSKLPINQKISSTSTYSSLLLGDFGYVKIGYVVKLFLKTLEERYMSQAAVGFIAMSMLDLLVIQPSAFLVLSGIAAP
jgi:HK97 family phage major capsid protein